MRMLAIDPGFAELGWAVLDFGAVQAVPGIGFAAVEAEVVACGVLRTAKETKKRKLHSGSDDGRRIDLLTEALVRLSVEQGVVQHREAWKYGAFHLGAYEIPSAAKGARAAHALGLAHAISRIALRRTCSSVVEITVADARTAAAGKPKAKEGDAHAAIKARWPRLVHATAHELDAIAVGLAALETPVGMALRGGQAA